MVEPKENITRDYQILNVPDKKMHPKAKQAETKTNEGLYSPGV